MAVKTIAQALNEAFHQEMQKNPKIVVLGEDVGKDGGVFRITDGLYQKFGPERVIDTPLAELSIAGVSVGLAAGGMKPVCEFQFDGFSIPALDQIIDHATRFRNRTRGALKCPAVFRFPYGGGIRALEHHSESPETHYIHTPGLKVVVPSTPYDAKGLLISALRETEDPIVFMEPKRIYSAFKQEVPDEPYTIPIGKASLVREGNDLTVICWGAMRQVCEQALDKAQVSADLIDLRTLWPLDIDAFVNSITKTGRVLIAHEAPRTLGFGAELMALAVEKCFLSLKGPPMRVTAYDVPTPLPKLEKYFWPDADRVLEGIRKIMQF